ncbi:hypothetical protein L916_21453 [Phytophthora nicotianae]|uniref:Uncharacterized protein n=1 Tax=Phytophthora nicotianae TaxID=4792 RepID=W2HTU6_PHYNI|nr:hypothetical protein L916_21453 [Phytophthora nicotianae]
MIKCVRADECNHRDVNHEFANLDQKTGVSPKTRNGAREKLYIFGDAQFRTASNLQGFTTPTI